MLLLIVFNYTILFTFIVGIYMLHVKKQSMPLFYQQYEHVFLGILLGTTGILLTGASFSSFGGYLVNVRLIPVLAAGLIGSPLTIIITGFMIGYSRFFMGDLTIPLVFGTANFMLLSFIMAIFHNRFPITFKNIHWYYFGIFIPTALFSYFFILPSFEQLNLLLAFVICTTFYFFLLKYTLQKRQQEALLVQHAANYEKIDTITKLPNHRWVYERCEEYVHSHMRFSVIRCYIYNFEEYHQHNGHLMRDQLITTTIQKLCDFDYAHPYQFAQLDSYEFVILMPDAPPAIALDFSAHFQHFMQDLDLSQHGIQLDKDIQLALGIASFPDQSGEAVDIIQAAGKALDKAKQKTHFTIEHANNLPETKTQR
ncbi:GGDEF domain-containing protein [Caryophanon tenue]|uniref:GGDEF domain-containing protein n=1 Tax=Caryophanon tenue TaxID=33978 RepID=A0A1C0Y874_9BACL|nr:diguanylate cyclase [Caryophanon tenue]OCS83350.1 hypothetical protein A6M13_04820 [Caryophanon tenue]